MKVDVVFPDEQTIKARCKELVFEIGLPPDMGGDPDAYGPFDLLLSGLALCTGHQVRAFLQERGLPIDQAGLVVSAERSPDSHLLEKISFELRVPEELPEKYDDAVMRAAEKCAVKQQLGCRPECQVSVTRV